MVVEPLQPLDEGQREEDTELEALWDTWCTVHVLCYVPRSKKCSRSHLADRVALRNCQVGTCVEWVWWRQGSAWSTLGRQRKGDPLSAKEPTARYQLMRVGSTRVVLSVHP